MYSVCIFISYIVLFCFIMFLTFMFSRFNLEIYVNVDVKEGNGKKIRNEEILTVSS